MRTTFSEAALRVLGDAGHTHEDLEPTPHRLTPGKVGHVLRKVADPHGEVFDAVQYLNEVELGAPKKRRRKHSALGQADAGYMTLEDRECCIAMVMDVNNRLHRLRVPFNFECFECGAKYRIEMGVTGYEQR